MSEKPPLREPRTASLIRLGDKLQELSSSSPHGLRDRIPPCPATQLSHRQHADIHRICVASTLHKMAELLSLPSAVITLVDFSAKLGGGLYTVIKCLKHAPEILEDLSTETQSLRAVLDDLRKRIPPPAETEPTGQRSEEGLLNIPADDESMLRSELRKAQEVMDQLGTLIEKILSQNVTRERVEWLLKKDRAGELKRQLAEANTRIQALLSASN